MSDKEFDDGDDIEDDDYGSEIDDDVDIVDEEDEENAEHEKDDAQGVRRGIRRVPDNERITTKFMTKYERARILGSRAL